MEPKISVSFPENLELRNRYITFHYKNMDPEISVPKTFSELLITGKKIFYIDEDLINLINIFYKDEDEHAEHARQTPAIRRSE